MDLKFSAEAAKIDITSQYDHVDSKGSLQNANIAVYISLCKLRCKLP